jgi:hypothetical protein
MTVSIGRPHYMTADMVKKLSDEGNVIAAIPGITTGLINTRTMVC